MRAVLAVLAALVLAPTAVAAPPPNDAPAGAIEFSAYGAGNLGEGQTATEREGVVDLTEASADPGVPRCLGAGSFERTVWFRVPAGTLARAVRVEASSPSGGSSDVPDLALFVGGQTTEPQSCDGPAVGPLASSGALAEAFVPPGQDVLVQVGRSADQAERRVIASLRVTDLPFGPAPLGDAFTDAPRVGLTPAGAEVGLAGATLTAEDPAQPACPAPATVWRRTALRRRGIHRVRASGAAATLTAFVGRAPTADNARACANRRSAAPLTVAVRTRRPTTLWTRVGTDTGAADAVARVAITRSRASLRIVRVVARRARVVARIRARGQDVRRLRVAVRRVTRAARRGTVRAGRTKRIRLRATLAPGRYRITASGRDGSRRVRAYRRFRVRG